MEFEVPFESSGKRLDIILKEMMPDCSRARLQRAIRNGSCIVDGTKELDPGRKITHGQKITLIIPDNKTSLVPEQGGVEVLWEDSYLAICNKPPALTIHPCPSCPGSTYLNILLSRFPEIGRQSGSRPGIVHRLDKDTSGLLLIALEEHTRQLLSEEFADHKISKEYLALVYGNPPDSGECAKSVGRDPVSRVKMAIVDESHGGKYARTRWEKIWTAANGEISLLKIRIYTGRTHQIRVHMAHMGFPIVGDKTYATKVARNLAPRQMLHAWKLEFEHPITHKRLKICSPPPQDFLETIFKSLVAIPVIVTGVPGSGKSAFSRLLANSGLPYISADAIVKDLYSAPGLVSDWLLHNGYGNILDEDKIVNRQKLFSLLKENQYFKKEFETWVHKLVGERIIKFWKENEKELAVVMEIPLYFESRLCGALPFKPKVVGVHCAEDVRKVRLMENRGWSEKRIAVVDSWQLPDFQKMAKCDIVINNSGTFQELEEAAENLLKNLGMEKKEAISKIEQEISHLCV